MNIHEILENINHRPWPIPKGRWKYYQEWNNVLFLHWQLPADVLRDAVPKGLNLDLFEGNA